MPRLPCDRDGNGRAGRGLSRDPVGDSVPASILVTPVAKRELRRGFTLNLDLRVCRRLVIPSCTFEGRAPTTALQAVQGYGRALGDVLIVKVGYNESAERYRQGIDRVMRAALSQGAKGVVWVTLRETRPIYHETNLAIKTAARRWPKLVVADWNAYSAATRGSVGTDCTFRAGERASSPRSSGVTWSRPWPSLRPPPAARATRGA